MTEGGVRGSRGWAAASALPLAALAILGFLALRDRQYLLIDDSYIAFRYAENLAHGAGLTWNPGERVEGYTNLLWVLLLAILAKVHLDLAVASAALSFVFAATTVVLVTRLSRQIDPDAEKWTHALPGLLLATNPSVGNTATSGMESSLFGFLVLLATLLLVRGRDTPRLRAWATLAYVLAYFTRPEGALVCGVALVVEALSAHGTPREKLRVALGVGVPVALAIAAHVACRLAYYGYPLPNTFYAKVIFGRATLARGLVHALGFVIAGGFLVLPGLLELRRRGPVHPWAVHGYALIGVYLLYLVAIGGDHPFWYRFYVPVLPLPLLATSRTLVRLLSPVRRRAGTAGALAAAVVFAGATSVFADGFAERRTAIGRLDAEGRASMEHVRAFFLNEAPPGSVVAAEAVGHLGYYAPDLRILDMWGLNDAHIAHTHAEPTAKFGHDKFDLGYVASKKPDYAYVLYATLEAFPIPTYDLCWPSQYFPIAVYRRNVPLSPNDAELGVPPGIRRRLAPPPPCRPPKAGPRL